jgi:hypothetical protein
MPRHTTVTDIVGCIARPTPTTVARVTMVDGTEAGVAIGETSTNLIEK